MLGPTWQTIYGAERAMECLASVELIGQRAIAERIVEKARETARIISADGRPTSALEVIMVAFRGGRTRVPELHIAAAIAIEVGLEPDEQARAIAKATFDGIQRDTAPIHRDNKPFSIFKQ